MSRSIRICSYLLLPLIYLLVNVKIAQLGESFPITIVTFLPVLLLLYVEKISIKKLMIALGLGMKEGGMDENAMISTLLGVSFVGAFLVCFSAWLLPYLKKVITPTVSGVVVMMIGFTLAVLLGVWIVVSQYLALAPGLA